MGSRLIVITMIAAGGLSLGWHDGPLSGRNSRSVEWGKGATEPVIVAATAIPGKSLQQIIKRLVGLEPFSPLRSIATLLLLGSAWLGAASYFGGKAGDPDDPQYPEQE